MSWSNTWTWRARSWWSEDWMTKQKQSLLCSAIGSCFMMLCFILSRMISRCGLKSNEEDASLEFQFIPGFHAWHTMANQMLARKANLPSKSLCWFWWGMITLLFWKFENGCWWALLLGRDFMLQSIHSSLHYCMYTLLGGDMVKMPHPE